MEFITGLTILASGISLVLLSSAMVTLTSGTIPVFMLAEPFILLGAIIGFVITVIKARKSDN
ncbi:MAG: hypothetical protein IIW70_04550 [Bacteroidales bacterium]|nr:hypothetical protein [Bacteroidales bacterium]